MSDDKQSITSATGIADIIEEIGIGIAKAQRALDDNSINTQNAIFADEGLFSSGLSATWYVIPEVSFTLKMEYAVNSESTESGNKQGGRIGDVLREKGRFMIVPSNAKYNNLYKTERNESSTLSLKFVPVPAPEKSTERRFMPDFIGKTAPEAEDAARMEGIGVTFKSGREGKVKAQSIPPGKMVMIKEVAELTMGGVN